MRRLTFILSSLLILACWTRAFAQAEDAPKAGPAILTEEQDEYPLGLHLEILEDPGGELTIEDIASPEFDSRFTPSQVEVPNYGFTDSAYWVRLPLLNKSRLNDRWLLEVGFANMQFVDLYAPLPNGQGFTVKQSGSLRPVSLRDVRYPNMVFELALPSQSQQTVYLRFQNGASMTLPLTLWSPDAFLIESQWSHLALGLYFGILLALLFYNSLVLLSLREITYLYLAILLASMIIFDASYTGYLEAYIIPGLYFLKKEYMALFFALVFIFMVLFTDNFLEIKQRSPKLRWVNTAILVVWGLLLLLIPLSSYHDIVILMVPWALLSLVAVLTLGIVSLRQGFRPARFFLFAWLGLVVTFFLVMVVRLDIVPSSGFSENAYRLGWVWMAVFWSLALADRINQLKAETEGANRDLRNSERRLSQILESLPLGVVVYGKDNKPNYVNQRSLELLANPAQGIRPDLSAGRTLGEAMDYYSFRVTGSDQEYPIEKLPIYRALRGEAASVDDIEADLVDRRLPLEIWATPVLDDTGAVEEAVVAFQDITTRKQAEMALRASEKKFRVIVENNFEGIVFMAHDRQVLYVSPSYERLSGFSAKEIIGQSGVGFVHPDDRARIAGVFGELLQQPGGRTTVEYRSKHHDGSWIWVETNALNILDDPHVQAVVLNIRDITERKETEAELADYRRSLELLVENRTAELSAANQRLNREIIEREVLEQLLYQHIAWLSTLNQVRQTIGGAADLPRAYEQLAAAILQLLGARKFFFLRWDDLGGQLERFFQSPQEDSRPLLERMKASFQEDSPLRREIEQGKIMVLTADQATSYSLPLGEFFQEDGFQSLILAPMSNRQSVVGVLGLAMPLPLQNFSPSQTNLVEAITIDVTDMAQNAAFLDQARALIATEERGRLARDLHDSVTQVLFSASLVAEVLPQIWRRDPEKALQSLEDLRRLTHGALAEMRTMLLELRPSSVIKTPLPELIAQLTEAITSRIELPFQLFIEQTPTLPEEVHTSFYRIAQEALNNVVKHAQANQVTVTLSATPLAPDSTAAARQEVKLVIEDDGVGYSAGLEREEHLGIGIMRERATAIRATLTMDSRLGHGTRLTLIW